MNLHIKYKTIKTLKEKIGKNCSELKLCEEFLDTIPKTHSIKEVEKWVLQKTLFRAWKDWVTDWEKAFVNCALDKDSISRKYKELSNSTARNQTFQLETGH